MAQESASSPRREQASIIAEAVDVSYRKFSTERRENRHKHARKGRETIGNDALEYQNMLLVCPLSSPNLLQRSGGGTYLRANQGPPGHHGDESHRRSIVILAADTVLRPQLDRNEGVFASSIGTAA